MTGLVARCCGEVLGGCVSLDPGYSCLRAWRATRGGEGDGIGGDGGLSSFCLATGVFGALLWLSCTAAQPAVCGIVSSALRRPTPSFRLLRTGCWKARYVSLRGWFAHANADYVYLCLFGARCSPSPRMQRTYCTIPDTWMDTLTNLCYSVGPFRHVCSLVLALLLARSESTGFSFRQTAFVQPLHRESK